MQYDTFIGNVQSRARLGSRQAAVRAIRATFQTLSERLPASEVQDLAAQLPGELAVYLDRDSEKVERFSLDELFHRVSVREHVDLPAAVYHTRVVVEVLREAVSAGEIEDVRRTLPAEFGRLFEAGSAGRMIH